MRAMIFGAAALTAALTAGCEFGVDPVPNMPDIGAVPDSVRFDTRAPDQGPACGNGRIEGSEECDDGDTDDTDACLSSCKLARCGDGKVFAGMEACDDGDADNTDACLDTCKKNSCGDGHVHAGVEACDDGNLSSNDACLKTCKKNTCGDGFVNTGVEECDDGDADNTDVCIDTCKLARCGDTYVFKGVEDCDDGNTVGGDSCPAYCKFLISGDPGKVAGVVRRFGMSSNAGVTVSLDGTSHTATTKSDGSFELTSVKAGVYDLSASVAGYQKGRFENITVIPKATFTISDLVLLVGERLDAGAAWAGLGVGDGKVAWIDLAGTLKIRSAAAGSAPTTVAKNVIAAAWVDKKKHLLYLTGAGELSALGVSAATPNKIAAKVSSYAFAQKDGWLLVKTWDGRLVFASPGGGTVHQVTAGYLSHKVLEKAKRILVVGTDGLFSLPLAGGAPVTIDADSKVVSTCSTITSSKACTTPFTLSLDETRVGYYARFSAAGTGEYRGASTAGGPVKIKIPVDLNLSGVTKQTASGYVSYYSGLIVVQEYGQKGGVSWKRVRVGSVATGKVVTLFDGTQSTGSSWLNSFLVSSDASSLASITRLTGVSNSYALAVFPMDGSAPVTLVKDSASLGAYQFSPDGKRIVFQPALSGSSGTTYTLMSAASTGGDLRTHETSSHQLSAIVSLNSDVIYTRFYYTSSSYAYDVKRVAYTSATPTTLHTCSSAGLNRVGYGLDSVASYYCKISGIYGSYIYATAAAAPTSLGSDYSLNTTLSPDLAAALIRGSGGTSGNSYYLINLKTGKHVTLVKHPSYISPVWNKTAAGTYNVLLVPPTNPRPLICGDTTTLTTKILGQTGATSTTVKTTSTNKQFLFWQDTTSGLALKAADLDSCAAVTLDSTAPSYAALALTLDDKAAIYSAGGGLRISLLVGSAPKTLCQSGKYRTLLKTHLVYSGAAYSPQGNIAALMSVPLGGGTSLPIDVTSSSVWGGDSALVYRGKDLRLVKLK